MAWGSSDGHDFMIDTSVFGIDGAVDIIIDIANRKFRKPA
jgi:cytidylate kinase